MLHVYWTLLSCSPSVANVTLCKYGLLTKREVKMAGYWPSSFFACLWTETESWSIKSINNLLFGFPGNFLAGHGG